VNQASLVLKRLLEDEEDFDFKDAAADAPESPRKFDFIFTDHGSVVLARPMHESAKAWLEETASDAQFYAGQLVIEPRYVEGVVRAMEDSGWTTNLRLRPEESLRESEDDYETIKDILGDTEPDEVTAEEPEVRGDVYRHDRWADVQIGDNHFCISYLTPVAVYLHGQGCHITDRRWGTATSSHIVKWLDHIGFGDFRRYSQVVAEIPSMPQQDLINLFRKEAKRVRWTKRQIKKQGAVPYNNIRTGLASGSDERVDLPRPPDND